MVKETQNGDGFYYDTFPSDRLYVIRWLKDGGWHYYPSKDGELPNGYANQEELDARLLKDSEDELIVSGSQASKYPVPKRW